jgi:hypothetical protein
MLRRHNSTVLGPTYYSLQSQISNVLELSWSQPFSNFGYKLHLFVSLNIQNIYFCYVYKCTVTKNISQSCGLEDHVDVQNITYLWQEEVFSSQHRFTLSIYEMHVRSAYYCKCYKLILEDSTGYTIVMSSQDPENRLGWKAQSRLK